MNNIANVGIKDEQKDAIKKLLKSGKSINSFVQQAVAEKLKRKSRVRGR